MISQSDLFGPADTEHEHCRTDPAPETAPTQDAPIAVPCGFRDRANNPCQRLGNWPVMTGGKQMVCRGRPMLHCEIACFNGTAVTRGDRDEDDETFWEDRNPTYSDAA